MDKYNWRFPKLDGGLEQGINDGGIATFKGSKLYTYLAREICQNSLDAKAEGEKTVIVEFNNLSLKKSEYPSLFALDSIFKDCRDYWEQRMEPKLERFLAEADKKLVNDTIVFTHILSLRREDAERLGYNNAQAWKDLVRRNVAEIAKAHNISLSNLQWYAGFHDKDHHPHIHLVVYSKDGKQGWITKKTIEDMRRLFGNDIFRNEQYKLFQMETQQRDLVKERVKDLLEDAFSMYPVSWEMQYLFETLRQQLKNYSGKKMYGYLPKDIKETVNKIVAEFAKDEDVAELYAEWNKINREKLSLYYEKKEPDIPLEDNKEFRSLKNDIIRAAVQMDNYLVNTGYSTEQRVGFLFTNVFRSFLRLFQNNYNRHANRLGRQMDRKLMSAIEAKKAAHGLKTDKGVVFDYNEPTM